MTRHWRARGLLLGALILAIAGGVLWPRHGPPARGNLASASASAGSPGPAVEYPRSSRLPNPAHRMLLGESYISLSGESSMEAAIEQREAAMGHHYDLEGTYYAWTDPFPDFGEAVIAAHGRTPLMAWFGPGKDPGDHTTLAEINNGREDTWIRRQAEAVKHFRKLIYLRLMPEMNGHWYPGYGAQPAAFIAAWRHIHDLFAQAGVHNVIWVWCPNLNPEDWDLYYPGNAYVDVIGVDGFNNSLRLRWRSFEQVFAPFLEHYAGRKPLMIAETATTSAHGSAASFIAAMHSYLKHVAGPRYGVIAVCWFDTDTVSFYNWRVDQTPAAWRAWLSLARDPYFSGS